MAFERLKATLELDPEGFKQGIRDAQSDLGDLEQKMQSTGKSMMRVGGAMTAAVSLPLAIIGQRALRTASDANEMQNKFEEVFGSTAADVEQWADRTADALGRSRYQLQQQAASFGDILIPMGASQKRAAEMSQTLTVLSQDLASFNNISEKRASEKLRSALVGETEAVRDFGVDVRQAAVDQELLNMGIEGGAEAANRMQTAQARLNIIMQETESAQGDAARTSDTFAGSMRRLRGQANEAGVELGQHLLPAATLLVRKVTTGVSAFASLSDKQQKAVVGFGAVFAAIGPVLVGLGALGVAVPAVTSGWATLTGAMATASGVMTGTVIPALVGTQIAAGPVTVPLWLIIAALGVLTATVAGAAYAWKNNVGGIRDTTTDAFHTIKGWFDSAPGWMLALLGPVGQIYLAWRENLFGVQDIVGNVFGWIGEKISWLKDQIGKIPGVGGDTLSVDTEIDQPDAPDEENFPKGFDPEAAGQSSGEQYASGFNDGLLDDISVDDVQEELQSQYEELRQQRVDAIRAGEETDISVADLQQAETRAESAREAESVDDVSTDALADAVESRIREKQEQSRRKSEVESILAERGVEGVSGGGGSGTADVDPEAAAAQAVSQRRGESGDQNDTGLGQSGGGPMQKLLEEIRQLKTALSSERMISGEVEFDPSSGMIQFVDGRINLAETQNFEDFSS